VVIVSGTVTAERASGLAYTTRSQTPVPRFLALVLGAGGALISFIGSWIPSFWGDEAATVVSAERPLSALWAELGRVDAVHGTYYLFMHFWIKLFGASELSVRLPSSIAVGIAVAGVVVLGTMLFSKRVAVMAAIVLVAIPRVNLDGVEGRSYATSAAIAVWLTIFFVLLVRSRSPRRMLWVAYGLAIAFSIYLFLYLVMLAGVHLLVLLSTHRNRMLLRRWLLSATVAVVAALPILVYGLSQHHQIAFLAGRNYANALSVFQAQWFDTPWIAIVAWTLIIVAAVVIARRYRNRFVLVFGWLALPTAALIIGHYTITPMYNLRYLSFCTPVVAIAIAVGIDAIPRTWAKVVVVALIVGLAVPSYVGARTQFAKDHATNYAGEPGSDLRQAAALVKSEAAPGDAVVFDRHVRPSRNPRLALRLYPQDFTGLQDVGLVKPYWQTSGLWDVTERPVDTRLDGIHTVWALELPEARTPSDIVTLEQLGYTVTKSTLVNRITVYELTQETTS
jgi:mannosyltransferase